MKNSEQLNKYHRLTVTDRAFIQNGLNAGMTVSEIATQLERTPSSIKREIERNREHIKSSGNDCLNRKDCHERNACKKRCNHKLCKNCKSVVCYQDENCANYIKGYCDKLNNTSPYVCNGCPKRQSCPFEKYEYKAGVAEKEAVKKKQGKIRPFRMPDEDIQKLDKCISPLIKNGYSPAAALNAVGDEVHTSTSSLYRMINAGVLTARNIDLPEKVGRRKRRPSKPKNKDVYATLAAEKKGHTYQDYLKYIEEHDIMTVQMDCVEGRKTDPEAILSLHWPEFHMQLYFIMPLHDAANVVAQLDIIEEALGLELFQECLPLILTDNGEEFTDIEEMERSYTEPGKKRTMIFFCEPNRSDQKGACERNHRLLRRIIPKRTSWDDNRNKSIHGLMQSHLTLATNHINSYPRTELNGARPFDMARIILPEDFFDMLGLETIPLTEVILKPQLIYRS